MKHFDLSSRSPDEPILRTADLSANLSARKFELRSVAIDAPTRPVPSLAKVTSARRKQLELLLANLSELAEMLAGQTTAIERRAGVRDVNNPLHPSLAKETARRRDNLLATINILEEKLRDCP